MADTYDVLFCAECDSRLEKDYCRKCNYHPSMQDTYIKKLTVDEICDAVKEWVASPNGQEAMLDAHNEAMRIVAEMRSKRSGIA